MKLALFGLGIMLGALIVEASHRVPSTVPAGRYYVFQTDGHGRLVPAMTPYRCEPLEDAQK